jgi:hypothetical protein
MLKSILLKNLHVARVVWQSNLKRSFPRNTEGILPPVKVNYFSTLDEDFNTRSHNDISNLLESYLLTFYVVVFVRIPVTMVQTGNSLLYC